MINTVAIIEAGIGAMSMGFVEAVEEVYWNRINSMKNL